MNRKYLVVDSPFNRANYPDLIGKEYDSPPSYAQVRVISQVTITLGEGIPDVHCDNCGKEHRYDPLMGWGCIVLIDERNIPSEIIGAWCDDECLEASVRFTFR